MVTRSRGEKPEKAGSLSLSGGTSAPVAVERDRDRFASQAGSPMPEISRTGALRLTPG